MARLSALLLAAIVLYAHPACASLKDTILGVKNAHNAAAADARLKHVQALNAASTNVAPTPNVDLASAGVLADDGTSLQVYTTTSVPSDAPAACQTALIASVACNSTILVLSEDQDWSTDELDLMCTSACTTALYAYRSGVASACGSYMITDPFDGSLYPATLAADTVLADYNTACERDGSGSYCAPIFATFPDVPTGDQGVLAWPQSDLCSECTMGALNITISNPSTYTVDAWNALQSALKICGANFAAYNVTNPPTPAVSVPGPSSTPLGSNSTSSNICALTGRNITVTGNSTCSALAAQYSVTASDVLQNNPVLNNANCTNGMHAFHPNGTQTCDDVVKAANQGQLAGAGQKITAVQLTTWNPSLQYICLTHTLLDSSTPICVTPHGGWPAVAADPGANGGNPVATPTAVAPPPGQTMPGDDRAMRRVGVCIDWVELQSAVTQHRPLPSLSNWAAGASITDGQASATVFSMSFPPLPTVTSAPYDIPPPAYATPPSNIAPELSRAGCSFYYNVTSDDVSASDACTTLATNWGMDPDLFAFYNNDTAHPCPQLVADESGMGPANKMAGSGPYGCRTWYTIANNDGCGTVASKFGLSSQQFFALNPELFTDCTNLVLGAAYCVSPPPAAAIPTSTTTTGPTSSATTTTSAAAPSQTIAAGSWTNCTNYYQVQSGGNCPMIEAMFAISQSDFLKWNPEIKGDCSNLDIQRYCVAGTPAACGKTYTVVSGDSCSLVESKNGISDATLHALNPWIDANCDIQVGQSICVGAPAAAPTNIAPGSWTNCTSLLPSRSKRQLQQDRNNGWHLLHGPTQVELRSQHRLHQPRSRFILRRRLSEDVREDIHGRQRRLLLARREQEQYQ
ncbi:hypothetical protein B0H14DRAFT_3862329 [Mycena olivaceomarginata]|nr:hypothetical protein B0H14DRAFT_3862329 [Mycena olivaceomarginata]